MVSTGSNDIDIKVNVDAKGAVSSVKQLDKEIEGLEKTTKGASTALAGFTKVISPTDLTNIARAIGDLAKGMVEVVKQGSAFNDVRTSFQQLTESAKASGDVLLKDFRKATQGTINDLQLMTKANKLLVLGLKPEYFDDLGRAASRYAETIGGDVNEVLDRWVEGLASANPQILLQIERTRELADVTPDAADNLAAMGVAFDNITDRLAESIATNATLNEKLGELATYLQTIDTDKLVGQIINATSAFVEFSTRGLAPAIGLLSSLPALLDIVADSFTVPKDAIALLEEEQENLAKALAMTGEAALVGMQGIEKNKDSNDKFLAGLKQTFTEIRKQMLALRGLGKDQKETAGATEELADAHIKLYEQIQELNDVTGIRGFISDLRQLRDALKDGVISNEKYSESLRGMLNILTASGVPLTQQQNILANGLNGASGTSSGPAGFGNAFLSSLGVNTNAITEGLTSDEAWDEVGTQIGAQIGSALLTTLQGVMDGSLTPEGAGGTVGGIAGTIGGAILGSAFGPAGTIVGAGLGNSIGTMLGSVVGGLFGGSDSAGTQARKELDKWFADLFNADRLEVIINGELVEIRDLVFQGLTNFGGQVNLSDGSSNTFLQSLSTEVQTVFNGVGAAFEELAGVGEDFSGLLAGVLANNVGGELNNLQLLVQATGQSFEQLAESLITGFNNGRLSALELQQALMSLQQVMEDGIPGAVGAVDQAFQNFVAAGFDGGQALFDAIQDLGIEAQELGLNTLPQLADLLVNHFGFAASEVQILITAITQAGISSVEDLAEASQEALTAIAANAQSITEGGTGGFTPVQIERPSNTFGGGRSTGGISRAKQEAQQRLSAIQQLVTSTQEYASILQSLKAGLIDQAQAKKLLNGLYKDANDLLTTHNELQEKAQSELEKLGRVSVKTAGDLEKINKKLERFGGKNSGIVNEEFLDFVKRFGDNLDLLKLGAEAAGIGFDGLKQSIVDAFLAGDLSAADALKGINNLGPGISDVTGGIGLAFANLIGAGRSGGRVSIDALKDIAAEAKELAAQSLEDLQAQLIGQGADERAVNQLFVALKDQGVTTLDELVNASDELGIKILAELDAIKFPFKDTTNEIREINRQIAEIPTAKDITINIKTNLDGRTQGILEELGIFKSGRYGEGEDARGIKKKRKRKKNKK